MRDIRREGHPLQGGERELARLVRLTIVTATPRLPHGLKLVVPNKAMTTAKTFKNRLNLYFVKVAKMTSKYVLWLGFCTGKHAPLRVNTALCTGVRFGTYLVRTWYVHHPGSVAATKSI